ncbi:MAG: putative phage-type endonuclease [Firmicutes bacterium]|nr:putative phage-type endonuclease [Bacillota bacterium]
MTVSVLAKTKDIERAEWLELRRQGIGGSDAPIVLGLSRYKSPVGLWLEKTGQIVPEEVGEYAYWGQRLEDIVAGEFTLRTGLKVKRKNAILTHSEYPFMIANIDRMIVGERAGLECKTTSAYRKDDWEGDNVPDAYYVQCQHYMAVTGYKTWYIACLIGGNTFVHKVVVRDDAFIERMIEVQKQFWDHVVNGTMPAVDGSDACADALKSLYPESNGKMVALPAIAESFITQYESAKQDEDAAKLRKQEAQHSLEELLGDNEIGQINGRAVNWKSRKAPERFDSKTFKVDFPDLHAKYAKVGEPSRWFSIKEM